MGGGLGRVNETSSYGREDDNNNDSYGAGGNESSSGSSGTHGASHSNTHGSSGGDSKFGKILEKAGGLLNNEKLEAKGEAKREEAGSGGQGGYGGSESNY